jgi:Gly-Xaa carboxypeptidase
MQLKSSTTTNYTLLPQGEADPLYPQPTPHRKRCQWAPRRVWHWVTPAVLAIVVVIALIATGKSKGKNEGWSPAVKEPACPQYPPLKGVSSERRDLEKEIEKEVISDEFFDKSLKKMQGAVQIPTESFDDMGKVGEDERWDIFEDFHAYLEEAFPLV